MKVLKFPVLKTQVDWVDEVKAQIKTDDKVLVAIQKPDGYVVTGYWDLTFAEKQVLLGHIQADIIHESILATYDISRKEYDNE